MSKGTEKGRVYPVPNIIGEGPETIQGRQFSESQDCYEDREPISPDMGPTLHKGSCLNGNLAISNINSSSLKSHVKT